MRLDADNVAHVNANANTDAKTQENISTHVNNAESMCPIERERQYHRFKDEPFVSGYRSSAK